MPIDDALADIGAALAGPQQPAGAPGLAPQQSAPCRKPV